MFRAEDLHFIKNEFIQREISRILLCSWFFTIFGAFGEQLFGGTPLANVM